MKASVKTGSQVPRFHTLISSVTVLQSCESDVGITLATGVSQWNDLTGNGKHYTQGTGTRQPLYNSINLGGFPVLSFDGVNSDVTGDLLVSTLVCPAPGTTPTWIWGIIQIEASTGFDRLISPNTGATNALLVTANAGPNITTFNTAANATANLAFNTWSRFEAYFSNSTNDYAAFGSSTVGGTNCGNTSTGTARVLGKQPSGTPAKFSIAAIMYCNAKPTTAEIANLNANAQGKYRNLLSL